MPDFFDTTIPLMSERLLRALRRAGADNIDDYPMILRRPDTGQEWRNYRAINVVGRLDAIDMSGSKHQPTASDAGIDFESIVLDKGAVGDSLCFRLDDGPRLIVIHEKIAAALAPLGFIAVMIQPLDEYDGD